MVRHGRDNSCMLDTLPEIGDSSIQLELRLHQLIIARQLYGRLFRPEPVIKIYSANYVSAFDFGRRQLAFPAPPLYSTEVLFKRIGYLLGGQEFIFECRGFLFHSTHTLVLNVSRW